MSLPTLSDSALPVYFRVQDAADYLALSRSKLNKLRTYGGGPRFAKVGKVIVYARADLDAWVALRFKTSTSEPSRVEQPPGAGAGVDNRRHAASTRA